MDKPDLIAALYPYRQDRTAGGARRWLDCADISSPRGGPVTGLHDPRGIVTRGFRSIRPQEMLLTGPIEQGDGERALSANRGKTQVLHGGRISPQNNGCFRFTAAATDDFEKGQELDVQRVVCGGARVHFSRSRRKKKLAWIG